MRTASFSCLLLALLSGSGPALAHPASMPLALDNVQIIEPGHDRATAPRCVRIVDGHIARVTAAGRSTCVRGADVVDLSGRYLLPGLIDMHAHLSLGPLEVRRERGQARMVATADDGIAKHNAERLVGFGVTTIRNPGGDLAAAGRYRQARSAGTVVGPESFDAGPVINTADIEGLATRVGNVAEVQQVVKAQVEAGADWIKLYTGLSPELLRAGIEAAHEHGRPAIGHLEAISWPEALDMGLDSIVHLMPTSPDLLPDGERRAWQSDARYGTFIFFEWWEHFDPDGPEADRLVASFDRHRPVFDATLVAFHAAFVEDLDNPYKDDARRYAHPRLLANWTEWFTFALGWTGDDFERARAIWPKVQRMAVRLYDSVAAMTVGTDMSNPWIAPGISLHREMQLLADAGVPNARILQAATGNAADALGAGDRIGHIGKGFEADLLVLDNNPLIDIAHARDIHAVVLDGRLIDTSTLKNLRGE